MDEKGEEIRWAFEEEAHKKFPYGWYDAGRFGGSRISLSRATRYRCRVMRGGQLQHQRKEFKQWWVVLQFNTVDF